MVLKLSYHHTENKFKLETVSHALYTSSQKSHFLTNSDIHSIAHNKYLIQIII